MKRSSNGCSLFLLAYFFYPSFLTTCLAADTITTNQNIRDGQTIVSAAGMFELGFFSPQGSNNRYVGIWYHNLQPQTVVWVANWQVPSTDTAGVLKVQNDSKIMIIDGKGNSVWSQGSFNATSLTVTLLDFGYFIVRGRNSTRETIVWKSLFYLTDTLLQGMRLAPINRRASGLRSWKNSSDPSRGSFTCRVSDTLSQPQLQLTNSRGSDLYYVSGSWNGSVFENIPKVNEKFLFHFKKLDKGFTYSSIYNRTRLVMDINGQLKFFIWHDMDAQWNLVWSVPTNVSAIIPRSCKNCTKRTIPNESNSKHSLKRRLLPMIILVPTAIWILSLGTFIYFWRRRYKRKGFGTAKDILNGDDFRKNGKKDLELPFFDFRSIAIATNNFSDSNKLGQGGFGHVYKGMLPGGQEVAVKRLSRTSRQGLEEFSNEVILIAKLQHRNLVRLIGYCVQEDEKMLLYEYMPNKSLDYFLFDQSHGSLLDWKRRLTIILGIARGLLYLHQDSRLRIIHRDLKTSNILLDEEMNPKISDFGLARMFGGNETQGITNRVVGTYGYMSPEYALDGLFSVKSDVFSFGVLLLEIISGKKNTGFYHSEHSLSLLGYVWRLWKEEKGWELMDPLLNEANNVQDALKCIHVGLLCVQEDAKDRPTIATVVTMLTSETANLPKPKQPAFYIKRSLSVVGSPSSRPAICSNNDITISNLEGR